MSPQRTVQEESVRNFILRARAFVGDLGASLDRRLRLWQKGAISLGMALLMGAFGLAWGAYLVWELLLRVGYTPWAASAVIAGLFWSLSFLAMASFTYLSVEQKDESRALDLKLERSGLELVAAARGVFNPGEILSAHIQEVTLLATAAGFLLGTQFHFSGRGDALDPADGKHH